MAVTIKSLLARGDYVAVEAGRLVITPKSGRPIPKEWAKQNLPALVADIARDGNPRATCDVDVDKVNLTRVVNVSGVDSALRRGSHFRHVTSTHQTGRCPAHCCEAGRCRRPPG